MKKKLEPKTEIDKVRQELAALQDEFQDFAYIVSHDISGPLRHAAGFAEMVLSNNKATLNEKAKRHLNHIITSAEAGRKTLEELRAYSRLNTRSQDLKTNVDIAALIDIAKDELTEKISETKAVINYEALPEITCDPDRITLVFKNLIENALIYQHSDTIAKIDITAKLENEFWVFTVKDNGIGISKDRIDDVFKVFRRAVEKTDFPGEGMGLPYAKKVVEKHNGRLWLESTSEQGSRFSFSIPESLSA